MSKEVLTLTVLLFCAHFGANAAMTDQSYVDDIDLDYKDGVWQCDRLICETFGCRILRHNDANNAAIMWTKNECYDEKNVSTKSTFYGRNLNIAIKIDVNMNSFINGKTVAAYGCATNMQYVNGTIAVADWPRVQESIRTCAANVGKPVEKP